MPLLPKEPTRVDSNPPHSGQGSPLNIRPAPKACVDEACKPKPPGEGEPDNLDPKQTKICARVCTIVASRFFGWEVSSVCPSLTAFGLVLAKRAHDRALARPAFVLCHGTMKDSVVFPEQVQESWGALVPNARHVPRMAF